MNKKAAASRAASAKVAGADSLDFAALVSAIARSHKESHAAVSRCDRRELFRYQRFYRTYPQFVETPSPQWALTGKKLRDSLSTSAGEVSAGTAAGVIGS